MHAGAIISGIGHLAVIALALFGLPERQVEDRSLPSTVSDVSIISLDEFEAARSSAPEVPEPVETALAKPEEAETETPAIEDDVAPELDSAAVMDVPEAGDAPQMHDLAMADPNVMTEIQAPTASPDDPVGLDTPLMDSLAQDGSINSTQTALLAPSTPNLAPRIDTTAAPKPPEDAKEGVEEKEAAVAVPDEAPVPEKEEEKPSEAPKEATTEITPDATEQESPLAPKAASRPKGRPRTVVKKEEPDTEEAMTREERLAAAIRQANDAQENVLAPSGGKRLGGDFSFAERQAVGAFIDKKWNKALIEGKTNFERLVVIVKVRMAADGTVMGKVEAIEPSRPSGDFKVAFDAARRAILMAQPIPLPKDKFRDGDYLEIRFDPGRSGISLQ